MRDRCCPKPLIRARPGKSCKAIHGAEFGVGDSYHVVRSERDIFVASGHLAGNGVLRLPAIAAVPRRGSGPIRLPDSGDVTEFRGGLPPHASGPIKVGAGPFARSLSLSLSLSAALPRFSLNLDLDSAFCRHHWALPPRLHPHDSDSTLPTQTPTSCPRSRLELPEAGDDAPATRGVRPHRAFPPNVLEARSGTAYHLYKGTERP